MARAWSNSKEIYNGSPFTISLLLLFDGLDIWLWVSTLVSSSKISNYSYSISLVSLINNLLLFFLISNINGTFIE